MGNYNSFRLGQSWRDTDGNLIQAHDGSALYHEGTFCWYGENKEHHAAGDKNSHWGVECYSSQDLYNWKKEGTSALTASSAVYSIILPRMVCTLPLVSGGLQRQRFYPMAERRRKPAKQDTSGCKPL